MPSSSSNDHDHQHHQRAEAAAIRAPEWRASFSRNERRRACPSGGRDFLSFQLASSTSRLPVAATCCFVRRSCKHDSQIGSCTRSLTGALSRSLTCNNYHLVHLRELLIICENTSAANTSRPIRGTVALSLSYSTCALYLTSATFSPFTTSSSERIEPHLAANSNR